MEGAGDTIFGPLYFIMAYVMRHSDKSGQVNVERVEGMIRTKVMGVQPSLRKREHEAAKGIHAKMLKENRARNGFKGRKKIFRHIASIPTSEMRRFRSEVPVQDSKALKRWVKQNQFNTVRSTSF